MKITKCEVTLVDSMGTDLSIVNAARVSFDKESQFLYDEDDPTIEYLSDKDVKLIKYLYTHNHWTPFAHTCLSFRIKAPIFIARQLGKHQVGLVWNEVSRRYVDDEPEFFFPEEWRGRPKNTKQGSEGIFDPNQPLYNLNIWLNHIYVKNLEIYNILIKDGLCPEQARMIIPQNMMTEWIWTGSLYAFLRVCKLRLDPHTQKETQDVAKEIAKYIEQKFPETWGVVMNTV